MSTNVKKRNWAFVLYPESAPSDWRERLQLSGLQVAVSPLHDKDVNPTGEPKKSHYHVILVFGSPTTFNNVSSFVTALNQPMPIPLEQVKGYYRYFTHKDNPEKYQYSESDIVTYNGFNIFDYCEITKSEVLTIKDELTSLIRDHHFIEYAVFCMYVQDNFDKVYFDIATSHTIYFNTFIKSLRHSKHFSRPVIDESTGEVLTFLDVEQ